MLTAGNWPREACAQGTDELASLRTQVSQLYNQGKYAEAAPIAERYADLARQKHGDTHTEYATAIAWLADVYQGQRRYAEAEPLYSARLPPGRGRSARSTQTSCNPQQPCRGLLLALCGTDDAVSMTVRERAGLNDDHLRASAFQCSKGVVHLVDIGDAS
jgi:Tetratricopeptide repeat